MMNAKERAIDAIEFFKAGQNVSAESVFNMLVEAIKEEMSPKLRPYQQKAIDDLRESFKQPQLIQGYTAEQWQEIIDGGYLCEFSGSGNKSTGKLEYIKDNVLDDHPFQQEDGSDWSYCRPAQIKGVMRPIFVEPVDKSSMLCLFERGGFPLNNRMSRPSWDGYRDGSGDFYAGAAKYIEL